MYLVGQNGRIYGGLDKGRKKDLLIPLLGFLILFLGYFILFGFLFPLPGSHGRHVESVGK